MTVGALASRFISVKPKLANTATDIHIVSDHGNEYTLELSEISGDDDTHFDSKVFITSVDKTAKERGDFVTELPVRGAISNGRPNRDSYAPADLNEWAWSLM